ncbi:GGDEF domain-containing protein [Microbacterium pumilum]|uniref:GGDEF domain-containing protein n=1 Tax=Microbacterium pumilum TaxID=344165 RepID=UPI0031D44334
MDEDGANALPVGLVRLRRSGEISEANRWFSEWVGTALDGIVGRSIDEFLVHAQEDLFPADVGPGPWVMLHAREHDRAVMVSRHRDGADDVLVIAEASERFRALTDLRRRYALADRTRTRLELVMDTSVAFSTASTEEHLAEILADSTARAYRAEESTVYLHEQDGTSAIAAGRDALGGRLDADSLIGLVSEPRQVVKVVDDEDGERLMTGLGSAMKAAGIRALIAAPLHHEEIDFGAFISWFHHERTFDDEAAPLAEALAGQAAQALATLRLQARLAHAATHDEVTGLPNRRLLETQMGEIVSATGCAVLFIDLDGFKSVNDRWGHQAGDRMLHDVAQRLLTGVRAGDLVARYGGDEFVVVCQISEPSVAVEITERILTLLRGDPTRPSTHQPLSASIGVAIAPPGSELVAEQVIRRADLAMYRAKTAGGNRIAFAED